MKSVITQIRPANAKRILRATEAHLQNFAVGQLTGDSLVEDVLKRSKKNGTTHLVTPFAELYLALTDALSGQKKKSPGIILIG
jgi:hypothetical protein